MPEDARERARAAGRHPQPLNEGRSRNMQAIRRTDTKPEVQVRAELHRRGFRFRKDLRVDLASARVRPDVVFTRSRVAIFIDGCFWHLCPVHGRQPKVNDWYWGPKFARILERDSAANAALEEAGWAVVRVWEHEGPKEAADRIAAIVRSRQLL